MVGPNSSYSPFEINTCWNVKFRHFLVEIFRQEVDIVLAGLTPAQFTP